MDPLWIVEVSFCLFDISGASFHVPRQDGKEGCLLDWLLVDDGEGKIQFRTGAEGIGAEGVGADVYGIGEGVETMMMIRR